MSYRSPHLLRLAQGQTCQACHMTSETVVACHVNSVALGKGTGIKAPDYYAAWLCGRCHDLYDGRAGRLTKEEKYSMWMSAFLGTVAQWFVQEKIILK